MPQGGQYRWNLKKLRRTFYSREDILRDRRKCKIQDCWEERGPEEKLREKIATDKVPYDLWVEQGWITLTPGEVVDYAFIIEYINSTAKERGYIPKELCYDKWNANMFGTEMTNLGYTCVDIRQGMPTLGEPTKSFREEVYKGNLVTITIRCFLGQ